MLAGAITSQIDVTQLVTALFFLFFAGLVFYLRREDKREGYPLEDPGPGKQPLVGFPLPPPPKQYNLLNGGTAEMPHHYSPSEVRAREQFGIAGDALVPTGDPLLDGIGPAAYALRKDEPMYAREGMIQMLPLRELPAWRVAEGDPDPRGMTVIGADGAVAGIVRDIWIDRSVKILRYIEVEVTTGSPPRRALLPIYYADVRRRRNEIRVRALLARQFADVPELREPNRITAREEDRINAFFSGGFFYLRQQNTGLVT